MKPIGGELKSRCQNANFSRSRDVATPRLDVLTTTSRCGSHDVETCEPRCRDVTKA